MSVKIYYNPRCSKSRATLELLQEKGIEPEIIEYMDNPPDIATLKDLVGMLGITPRELMRRHARSDARRIRDEILNALRLFLGSRRAEDDITLMVVKVLAHDSVGATPGE